MYGIDAINANNGWAIAAVGITIVFSGLVSLSFIISQLHRILDFFSDPGKYNFIKSKSSNDEKEMSVSLTLSKSHKEAAKQLFVLVEKIRKKEKSFSLPKLLLTAEISGLEKPHANINALIDTGIIEPDMQGFFLWNKERYNKLVS